MNAKLVYGYGVNDSDRNYRKSEEYRVFYASWVSMFKVGESVVLKSSSQNKVMRIQAYKD